MDAVLHAERLDRFAKRTHRADIADLPDGVMIAREGAALAVRGDALLRWSPASYLERRLRPASGAVDVLTPPPVIGVLAAGYRPHWHPSAYAL
jgi:hypothetical protein